MNLVDSYTSKLIESSLLYIQVIYEQYIAIKSSQFE